MSRTDHPEWTALLKAVVTNPDDDTPRLVAADLTGGSRRRGPGGVHPRPGRTREPGRIRLGKYPDGGRPAEDGENLPRAVSVSPPPVGGPKACPQLVRVRFRENVPNPLTAIQVDGADRLVFHRGFVAWVTCPAETWFRHARDVRGRNPIRALDLTGCGGLKRDHWYAAQPALTGLKYLDVDTAAPGPARLAPGPASETAPCPMAVIPF